MTSVPLALVKRCVRACDVGARRYKKLMPDAPLDPDERACLFTKYVDFFLDTGHLGVSDHHIDTVVGQILDDRVSAPIAAFNSRLDCTLMVQCNVRIKLAFMRMGVIRQEKKRLSVLRVCVKQWKRRVWHWGVLRRRRTFHVFRKYVQTVRRKRLYYRVCFWPWYVWNRHVNQQIFARGKANFLKKVWVAYRKRHFLLQWSRAAKRAVRNRAMVKSVRLRVVACRGVCVCEEEVEEAGWGGAAPVS